MSKAIQFRNKKGEKIYPCPYYPIGSIYLSVTNTNPGTIFGGTWEQIKDRFLLGAGSSYTAGNTGGSSTHTHGSVNNQNGSLEAMIGSANGQADAIAFRASNKNSTITPTYIVAGSNRSVGNVNSHNTAVFGQTSSGSNIPPYLVVYIWKRVS